MNNPPKLKGKTARDLADGINIKPEKLTAKPVEIPDAPKLVVKSPTPLELFWAWLIGYARQEVANASEGKRVTNPFPLSTIAGFVANWWKWLAILVVISGIIFAVWLTAK